MANNFDRIIKENFQELNIGLIRKITGAESVEVIPMPQKIQRTLERGTDNLLLITTKDGKKYIANLEWQTSNARDMPGRMLLYHAAIFDKYKLPVVGFVIYIGRKKLSMKNQLKHPGLQFEFKIIDLMGMDPEEFLCSEFPAMIMLSILAGNTKKDEKREIIRKVLNKLQAILKNDPHRLLHSIAQLEILGDLRNIQNQIIEEEKNMAIVYNLKRDIRYRQGLEAGRAEAKADIIATNENYASTLYKLGVDLKIIQKATGLTAKRLKEIIAEVNSCL